MEGKFLQHDGRKVASFERYLDHSVEKVWGAITSPQQIVNWLNAQAEFDLIVDGKIIFRWENGDLVHGKFIKINPPSELEYTWEEKSSGRSLVRWELKDDDGKCHLHLTHTFFESAVIADFLAGWHVHLEMLDMTLQEKSIDFPGERFKEMREKYVSILN
ncbi:SRPBCC family protein [Paenibacillus sp. GSMTC-2017]|uniref:SRPBCC family protein n=1 Tax=Paenibacillus sp. GSMTC-2017 TaxID=2794350 RepID=UPI0018D76BCC|nr:SRPBCC family protein [Paenibacillus sp. GSMTC-2017]MBH5316294.1 SRPBCC family protein [Paenibacillus sp. GSMTC-2017]